MAEKHTHIHITLPRGATADYGPFTQSLHPRNPGGKFVKSKKGEKAKKRLSKAKKYKKK
jgi:hypothetical protein